jgi:hypothetical protein
MERAEVQPVHDTIVFFEDLLFRTLELLRCAGPIAVHHRSAHLRVLLLDVGVVTARGGQHEGEDRDEEQRRTSAGGDGRAHEYLL